MQEAWRSLLEARTAGFVAVVAARLAELLKGSTSSWMGQAAETSVQAKHAVALELEFVAGSDAEVEVERLQLEGALLAQHLLAKRNPVRLRAEAALLEWRGRLLPPGAAGAAAANGAQRAGTWEQVPHARQSELLRMLLGMSLPVVANPMAEGSTFEEEEPLWDCVQFPAIRGTPTSSSAPFSLTSPSRDGSTWSHRSAPPGELFKESSDWGPQGLPDGGSWRSTRRSPIFLTMSGAGGKAAWALRTSSDNPKGQRGQRLNPFQDWLRNVAGDSKPLKERVLESTAGQEDYYQNMRENSRRFKHFWLKEEVDSDALNEDRILYCAEGMSLKRRQQKARSIREVATHMAASTQAEEDTPDIPVSAEKRRQAKTEATRKLFKEYGLSCSASDPGLADMRKLLAVSQNRALQAFEDQDSARAGKKRGRHPAPK